MLRRILPVMLALVLCCAGVQAAQAEESAPAKRADILKLIEVSGGRELAQQLLQQYVKQSMGMVRKLRPDIPASSLPAVERDLSAFVAEKLAAPGGLLDLVAAVYARHFTPEEIRQLLAFYESPVGRKSVATLPQIMKESRDAAQGLGISLIPELNRRVSEVLRREAASQSNQQPGQQASPQ